MKMILMQNKVDKSKMFVASVANSKKPQYLVIDEVKATVVFIKEEFKIPGKMHNCKGYFVFEGVVYGVFKDNSIMETIEVNDSNV